MACFATTRVTVTTTDRIYWGKWHISLYHSLTTIELITLNITYPTFPTLAVSSPLSQYFSSHWFTLRQLRQCASVTNLAINPPLFFDRPFQRQRRQGLGLSQSVVQEQGLDKNIGQGLVQGQGLDEDRRQGLDHRGQRRLATATTFNPVPMVNQYSWSTPRYPLYQHIPSTHSLNTYHRHILCTHTFSMHLVLSMSM